MQAGSRAGCHVTRTRGRLGDVVATAVVGGTSRVRLQRRAAASRRGIPGLSIHMARAGAGASAVLASRLRGHRMLTLRARARGAVRRCISAVGARAGPPRCRLAAGAGRSRWILAQGAVRRDGRIVDGLDVMQVLIHAG
jgi:hypothetical protein